MKIVSQSIKQRNPEPRLCTTRFNEKRRVSFRRFYLEKYTFYNQCISKLPVVSFSRTFQTLTPPYHLKTSAKLRQLNFKLLAGCQRVRFLSLPPPPPSSLYLRLCVWHVVWIPAQRTIHCGRTRPPSVLCFPHSSALTSARLQEGRCLNSQPAVCGKRPPTPS